MGKIIAGLVFILMICGGGIAWQVGVHEQRTARVSICSVESTVANKTNQYRVYGVNQRDDVVSTYIIEDSNWPSTWRQNSADYYGELKRQVPGTFDITYFGYRAGFFSAFPNIKDFKKVNDTHPGC